MPIDALVGYAQVTKKQVQESRTEVLSNSQKTSLSDILGKHFRSARFASPDVDEEKRVGVLGRDFGEYSQFHQGAGESATLDLIGTLEPIKANALILIDEIEASLHPKAQRRLIKAILKLARKNAWQIVISTHSPYILEQLPPEARVLLMRTDKVNVVYRSSPEFCLSSLDEKNYPELTILVEDREAQTLLREILRRFAPDASKRCEIYPVGPVNVVNTLGNLSQREKLPYKSIGVVDGGEETQSCWTLPGMAPPERLIFGELYQAGWPEAVHRFGLGAGELHAILEDAMLAEDHHDWTIRAGDELQRSRHFVWETLSELWVKHVAKEERISALREAVESRLQE
jgi:energy-coupling factor transporter ATP-binding protein EcfA2